MNIERYIMPVIIAAGLHGALLLSFVDPVVIFPPGKTKDGPQDEPPDRMQMIPDNSNEGDAGDNASGAEAPPLIPDVLMELPKEDIFVVHVTPVTAPIVPILNLPKIPEKFGDGSGDGKEGLRNGLKGVIGVGQLDRNPRAVVQSAPSYPAAMRTSGTNGSVTVQFVVDTTGRVVSAEAVRWTQREFVDPAVQAVLRWRFEPGTLNGRKVNFRMAVPIEFYAAL